MKRETLEKIRKIIVTLLVLFISILNTWIAFCTLPVHAEESFYINDSNISGSVVIQNYLTFVNNSGKSETDLREWDLDIPDPGFYALAPLTDSNSIYALYKFDISTHVVNTVNVSYTEITDWNEEGKSILHNETKRTNRILSFDVASWGDSFTNSNGVTYSQKWVNPFPVFESSDAMLNYCKTGDTSGLINGGSIDNPDFEDTAYAFTGFTSNNIMTAAWTGTTERSFLQDQEVEEYVRVNYYFADKEAQDTIKQADAYPDEFATADKTLTIDVSGLKPDDENWFLRYIRITPCYRQAGLGAWGDFYHGSDVYVYFDVKGNIEKVIQKSKPTDLNKGNMVYDSSIGYLQNVIYTEQKTHDGSGRQATFKWSTLKSLPDDAQIEIVAQNFYIEWFNKKTEENFIYKEYGEDCFYSAGSYSFNANTPVWTWLKEKEIDPFSIKTQSYGSTEYYLRIVVYNDSDSLYHYGGWVKVDIKSKDTTIMPSTDVETGGFDDSSGLWNQDTASSDSYHYSTDDKGKLTGNIDVNSWEDLNMNSFTWMYRNMQSMVSSLGEFPAMVNAVFGYLPVQYITSIGVLLVAIVLLRFLGR